MNSQQPNRSRLKLTALFASFSVPAALRDVTQTAVRTSGPMPKCDARAMFLEP